MLWPPICTAHTWLGRGPPAATNSKHRAPPSLWAGAPTLMPAITSSSATNDAALASSPDGGGCALCGATYLTSVRDGVTFCQLCLSLAPAAAPLPEAGSTPRITTQNGLGMWRGLAARKPLPEELGLKLYPRTCCWH